MNCMLEEGSGGGRRQNDAGAVAKADARKTIALAPATKNHFVAVLQKLAFFTVRQSDRLRAAPGELEQAAAGLFGRAGNCPAAEQVARTKVAAVTRVVCDELCRSPVQISKRRARQALGRRIRIAH